MKVGLPVTNPLIYGKKWSEGTRAVKPIYTLYFYILAALLYEIILRASICEASHFPSTQNYFVVMRALAKSI
jgi:hypothetical protein